MWADWIVVCLLLCCCCCFCCVDAQTATPETPVITPPSGTYINYVLVDITVPAPNQNDAIYYGKGPVIFANPLFMTLKGPGPIFVTGSAQLVSTTAVWAYAQRPGYGPSAIVSATYTIVLQLYVYPPSISVQIVPPLNTAQVTITSTSPAPGKVTYYAVDLDPTITLNETTGLVYSGPFIVSSNGMHTVRSRDIATVVGGVLRNASDESSVSFFVSAIDVPMVQPPDGAYTLSSSSSSLIVSAQCPSSLPSCIVLCSIDSTTISLTPCSLPLSLSPGLHRLKFATSDPSSPNNQSPIIQMQYAVVGLISPLIFFPATGSTLTSGSSVIVTTSSASDNDAQVWLLLRSSEEEQKNLGAPLPDITPSSQWVLLLPGTNLTLSQVGNFTIHATASKLYYLPPKPTSATFLVIAPTDTSSAQVDSSSPNLIWLLFLLLLIPPGVIAFIYLYKKKQERESIENDVFAHLGFNFDE